MDQEYDVIVLGTGLKECIMSGLLSSSGQKVLHMDRNSYYGGESASLNLEQLYKRFRGDQAPPATLGRPRDYCVDLCPKFLMACGDLVKVLLHTRVTRYLEFKSINGSYVEQSGKPHKVPSTPSEALSSSLMGIFQKRRFRNFITYVHNYNQDDLKTHEGLDLDKKTSQEVFSHFKLDTHTQTFTGHAIALYLDDSYLKKPARELVERCKLYAYSVSRYGNSPYIYPLWGLGGLPEGFSRLAAIHGGVYMLNKPVDKILYDSEGKVTGVESQGETARCKKLLADPSYFIGTDKIKKTGQVARCICIMSHPIPNTNGESAQIILPASEHKRNSDIYISMVSYHHKVAANGKYIAVLSTEVESKEARKELEPAFKLIGKVDEEFFWVADYYEPTSDGSKDNVFISTSFDATSHFESATVETLRMWERVTGKKLDMTISAEPDDLQDDGSNDPAPQAAQTAPAPAAVDPAEAALMAQLDGPEEPTEG